MGLHDELMAVEWRTGEPYIHALQATQHGEAFDCC